MYGMENGKLSKKIFIRNISLNKFESFFFFVQYEAIDRIIDRFLSKKKLLFLK